MDFSQQFDSKDSKVVVPVYGDLSAPSQTMVANAASLSPCDTARNPLDETMMQQKSGQFLVKDNLSHQSSNHN